MPISYDEIIRARWDGLQLERQRALNDLETSRLAEDYSGVNYSAETLENIDSRLAVLDKIASNYVMAQQHQQQGSRYGLTRDEQQIAHGIAGNDPNMTNDQREAMYLQNKQRLQYLRSTGQYRDDQGRR